MSLDKHAQTSAEEQELEEFIIDDSEQNIGLISGDFTNHQTGSAGDRISSKQHHHKKTSSKHKIKKMLAGNATGNILQQQRKQRKRAHSKIGETMLVLCIPLASLFLLLVLMAVVSRPGSKDSTDKGASPAAAPTGFEYPSGFDMKQNWGAYSPYFDTGNNYDTIRTPTEAEKLALSKYKQVHVLHRHGERYPAGSTTTKMKNIADKLKNMSEPANEKLQWLDNWQYTLGEDLLVMKGVATEFSSGAMFWETHGRILYNGTHELQYSESLNTYDNGTQRPLPVLRTTDQSRIVTSARAWAAGFFGVYGGQPESPSDEQGLYNMIVQKEDYGFNSTLAPYYSCKNNDVYEDDGKKHELAWINSYMANAAKRLQKLLPGVDNITAVDAFGMQAICVFEYAALGSSPFCGLFTETEWRGFEYANDLKFYGESSFGSKTAAAEGSGWLKELLARLEGTTPAEGNGVNVTQVQQLPVDQPFYMDMSHDTVIVSVLTALGLDFLDMKLPQDKIPVPRPFIVSRLTPFGARLYVEVLEDDNVRMKLNNRVLPLGSLSHCPKDELGRCPLNKFIKSLHTSLKKIDYDAICFGPVEEDKGEENQA